MRAHFLFVSCFPAILAALPAPAAAADLGAGFSLAGGTTIVSDYRFRGVSLSGRNPALQGSLTLSHSSGFYATVWTSTIHDYGAANASREIDLIAGYSRSFGGTTLDAGLTYYVYAGSDAAHSDLVEPYVSLSETLGPVNAKLSANYAPRQAALSIGHGKEDNLYLAADLSAALPGSPWGIAAHLGHSSGPRAFTLGRHYADWSLGGTYRWHALTLGLSYVDTDCDPVTPSGRHIAKAGLVASLGASF
jgi:uncharacterized protein (TIGR02001 family)